MRHSSFIAVLAVAGALAAPAAMAGTVTVGGSASFTDLSNCNDLWVTAAFGGTGKNGDNFTLPVTPGATATYSDFLTLCASLIGFGSPTTDNVAVSFDITQPGSGSGSVGGAVTAQYNGIFNPVTGSVTWGSPLDLTLSNGDTLAIGLANTTLKQGSGCAFDDACGNVDANFTLTASNGGGNNNPPPPPPTVPEPASLALLGSAVLGLGLVRRGRRPRA